ncbi:MAG: alpha/beta fold hydrolase, partial [Kamptonema sp. SIO4C4]|nr:alpha/beta fold hydrolase [Kamptonema sp. SIO4C4]
MTENTLTNGSLGWFYRQILPTSETDKLPVVLLHGIPSQSYSWRGVMPALMEYGFRAIAPDWLGHGFSDKPDKRDFSYIPDAYIQALDEFLETLDLTPCHLVVQGFLGSVGIQYALRNPEKIDRLVILNTPLSSTVKLPWKMKLWGVPFVGDMLTQDPLLIDRTLEGGSGFVIQDEDLDMYRRPFLQTSDTGRSLLATVQNLQLLKVTSEIAKGLSEWKKPTQIIWGMNDPWLLSDNAEVFSDRPNFDFDPLPEA